MLVKGITLEQAQSIAERLSIRLQDVDKRGNFLKMLLRPVWDKENPYQRVSANSRTKSGEPRKVASICWHGHRDFMRKVFEVNPNATIKTSMASYYGVDDFEHKYIDTFDPCQNLSVVGLGSQYHGFTPYGELCLCFRRSS